MDGCPIDSGAHRLKDQGSLPDAEIDLKAFIPGLKPGDFCEGIKSLSEGRP